MTTWFTSDHHFAHANILQYEYRPWEKIDQMDKGLIRRHNELVSKDDEVWFIGDFSLKGSGARNWYELTLSKLNGTKHLVLGNHDRMKPFAYVDCGFASVHTGIKITIEGYEIVMVHDPSASIMFKDRLVLCGHVHSLFRFRTFLEGGVVMNVGVDVWDWRPVSLKTVVNFARKQFSGQFQHWALRNMRS